MEQQKICKNAQEKIYNDLQCNISKEQIYVDEPMKKHTTFKIGGVADFFIKINNTKELKYILKYAKTNNIPLNIIGNGSNILVKDNGIRGITIQLNIDDISIVNEVETSINNLKLEEKVKVIVGSSVKLGALSVKLKDNCLSGFEFAAGIPGTIGGAVYMNAGAYGGEMKDIVEKVICIDRNGEEIILNNDEMRFSYRSSILKSNDYIVTQVILNLRKGNKKEIEQKMDEYKKNRIEKQPLDYPNAGSTFKRGEDFVTAMLIDEAGLKGCKIGGAEVSRKHAGFIVNTGDATAKDVLDLINYIKKVIKEKFDKEIQEEIVILGE